MSYTGIVLFPRPYYGPTSYSPPSLTYWSRTSIADGPATCEGPALPAELMGLRDRPFNRNGRPLQGRFRTKYRRRHHARQGWQESRHQPAHRPPPQRIGRSQEFASCLLSSAL